MATTNALSTSLSLTKFLHLLGTIPDHKSTTAKELVGTGDDSTAVFWLDKLGVIESTYTLSYGAAETSVTDLTETTHYVLDLDTSKLTLTATGITAVSTNNIYAVYQYNKLELLNSDILKALNAAENKLLRDTDQIFADQTATNPLFKKVVNESIKGHHNPYEKVFDFHFQPTIKLQTTTNGAFTLGGTTLTLTSGTGFPTTGTIYVGGNKVVYTAKSTNDLTVPATTPSIATGATVRGEVIEVSIQPEGSSPSYAVLDPDTEYEIDYNQGRIKPLANAYWGEITARDRIFHSNYLIRVSYMHAWHEMEEIATIPDEIEWVVNAIAARRLMGSVVAKATEAGINDFNPALIDVDKEAIMEVIDEYTTLNVGSSPYNKQSLT